MKKAVRRFLNALLKLLLTTITILVLYTNIAIVLDCTPLKPNLPTPRILRLTFDIYQVFSVYQSFNKDYLLGVVVPDEGAERWVRLNTREYFPFKRGAQHWRINATMHQLYGRHYHEARSERECQYDAHKAVLHKILERYNRLHPEQPATRAGIVLERWPRSRESYTALKKPGRVKYQNILSVEGPSPASERLDNAIK